MEILKLVKRLIDMFQKQLELSYRRKCYAKKKDQVFLYIKDEIEKISSAEEKEIFR